MNISNIDLAPPESKALSPKTDTEGTDLFSILMASITAGNGIQQGSNNLTADGCGSSLEGQLTFPPIDGGIPSQDVDPDTTVTDMAAGFMIPLPDGSRYVGDDASILTTLNRKVSGSSAIPDTGKKGEDGVKAQVPDPDQAEKILKQIVEGKLVKDPSQVKNEGPVDMTNSISLLPHAVKGVKEGAGIEAKESNLKDGTIVSGNDEGETVEGLDIGDGIVTAFGRESINPGLLHISAKTLAESAPALRNIHRPQIDPVDLVAQVSGKIKADFKSEGGEVRMELHPESLGHLKIEIKVEGGVIRANILTENAMVKDTIDSNLSMLRSSLEEHGLRIDQLSVGIGHQHAGNAFAERKDVQMWQGFDNADSSRYEGEESVNDSWYSVDSWQEQGISIFA